MASFPGITLRLMRYFAVLGAELNYRRAAEQLYITQPALSGAIQKLERLVGERLFDRNTRSVQLTDTGAQWLPYVQRALAEVDAALDAGALLVDDAPVRIGYLIGTGADLLFDLLEDTEQAFPGMTIETQEFDFTDPSAGLESGAVDLALLRPPVDLPGLEFSIVDEESWVACLPRNHHLASRKELRIDELLDEPIVVAPESAGAWREYWYAGDVRSEPPPIAAIAATYEQETTLVSRGVGLSFTTSSMARLYDRPGVTFVPIIDRPTSYTAIAWTPDRLGVSAERLLRHMRDRVTYRP